MGHPWIGRETIKDSRIYIFTGNLTRREQRLCVNSFHEILQYRFALKGKVQISIVILLNCDRSSMMCIKFSILYLLSTSQHGGKRA